MIKPKKLSKPQKWYGDEPSKQYVKLFGKSEVAGVKFTEKFGKKFPNQLFQIPLADIDSVANSISLMVEKVND